MARLTDLPREVLRMIALFIYDPLELSQQDRLTWGIFSTVDMHEERQDGLYSLINFGDTCRVVRREVRIILFRCIRTPTIWHATEAILYDWAPYVRSIIIDLTMFDMDERPHEERWPRSCWEESEILTRLLKGLPNVEHVSFFADASDDSTLCLTFSNLLQPNPHDDCCGMPFYARLRSFGWRQRATPPNDLRPFSQTSTFVSIHNVLRHAYNLSFVVLDADMGEMEPSDIISAMAQLEQRKAPNGEQPALVSLMVCGPIAEWEGDFLPHFVQSFTGIKELFIDRPLKKTSIAITDENEFIMLLQPLHVLPYLKLLQVGSYTFPKDTQYEIAHRVAHMIPSLTAIGLLGAEGETTWWGAWRGRGLEVYVRPMKDGHLFMLEKCARASRRPSLAGIEEMISRSRRGSHSSDVIIRSRRSSIGGGGGGVGVGIGGGSGGAAVGPVGTAGTGGPVMAWQDDSPYNNYTTRSRRSSCNSEVEEVRIRRSFLTSIDDKLRPLSSITPEKKVRGSGAEPRSRSQSCEHGAGP